MSNYSCIRSALFTYLILLASCATLTACFEEKKEQIAVQSMLRDTPEARRMLSAFSKQAHRIELNGCNFRYNDTGFELGGVSEKIKNRLGAPEREEQSNTNIASYWLDGALVIRENLEDNRINLFSINFEHTYFENKEFYVLVEGIPLGKGMTMKQFIDSSFYEFDQFEFGNFSYERVFNNCTKPIVYYYSSDVKFKYIGNGHARLKGEPDLSNTSRVESLEVSFY